MAAAQARAAWQRIANRVLVQDDAKRAPKFSNLSPPVPTPRPISDLNGSPDESSHQPIMDRNSSNSGCYAIGTLDTQKAPLRENLIPRSKGPAASDADDALEASVTVEKKKKPNVKVEPWWRLAGKEELSLLVMQRITEKVENCDLPRPETVMYLDDPPSKTQVLGALRFSQTRAREAETAAQEARREKERIISLIFKQAAAAFALRLWIQMLQIERLLLRRRIKTDGTRFPARHRFREKKASAPWRVFGLVVVGAGVLLGCLCSSPLWSDKYNTQ